MKPKELHNHELTSNEQERKAINDMAVIRSAQNERSHTRLKDFNGIETQSDHVPFKDTIVRIGILDDDGMHTVRVHSPEEAAHALAAAYGWDDTQNIDTSPVAAETNTNRISREQDLQEISELQELLNNEEWDEWVREQESRRSSVDPIKFDEPFDGEEMEY